MREHGETGGRRRGGQGRAGPVRASGRPVGGRGGAAVTGRSGVGPTRSAPAVARRRSRGPRPVRPAVVPVAVRPARPQRSACGAVAVRSRRVRVRRPLAAPARTALRLQVRRALGAAVLGVTTAAVVAGLGLLAGAAGQARVAGTPAPAVAVSGVAVEEQQTVRDLARGVAPAASGSESAAVAERIVTDDSLTSVHLHPWQVLRVTAR
jgi:hypothetical protein